MALRSLGHDNGAMADEHVPSGFGAATPAPVFVGRDAEIDRLRAHVVEARRARGRLVVVAGEAGIGKTRLCEEVAPEAREHGFVTHWAACAQFAGHPAYSCWSQFLAQMGHAFPAPNGDLDVRRDAETARRVVFESVAALLRRASAAAPRLLVLDDIQWADDASIVLLSYLAPVLRTLPVLMLVTRRVDDADAGRDLLRDVERQAVILALRGLTPSAVGELASSCVAAPVSDVQAGAVHELTAGNPLFARELVAHLATTSTLESFASGQVRGVPRTVREIQAARLDHVSHDCREVLELAAVIGAEFHLPLLGEVLGMELTTLLALLDEAVDAGLVREVGNGRFTFTHPLLAAALHEGLDVSRRVGMHERVGLVLEAAPGPRDLSALAHHFMSALSVTTAPRAIDYCAAAAAEAMSALAYSDAARLYEQAMEAQSLAPATGDRTHFLLALGEARAADGVPSSREALLEAARCARAELRAEELAAAALGLASGRGFEVGLFDETQVGLLQEALATLPDDALILRSMCSSRLSIALSMTGSEERRAELSDSAVDLARSAGDAAALAAALASACDVRAGPGWTRYRLEAADEIVGTARSSRDRYGELLGRRLRMVALLETGDLTEAEAETSRFARVAERLGQTVHRWYVPLWRATLSAARGHLGEALELGAEAERLGGRAHSTNAGLLVPAQRIFVLRELGDRDLLLRSLDELQADGFTPDLGVFATGTIAFGKATTGQKDEAAALLDRVAVDLPAVTVDSEWLPLLVQAAETVFELGGHEVADWLHQALVPCGESWAVEGIGAYVHGSVARHAGLLAALLDEPDEARRHFEAAIGANRRAGASLLVARTFWDGGIALDDPRWIQQGLADYRACGLSERADQLEASLGGSGSAPGSGSVRTRAAGVPTFHRKGDLWVVEYAGVTAHVRDSKGVGDLARLLGAPGQEIAALDLARGPVPAAGPVPGDMRVEGDLGDVVDLQARSAYKARLAAIDEELDEADADGDAARSVSLAAEREALLAQLTAAYGLRGRPRRAGDPAERARTAVTARVRDAIRRIAKVHPDLGHHLSRSVRTGAFCVYEP